MDSIDNDMSKNQKGTSNIVITVLIIISMLVTIIGTWAVLNTINPVNEPVQKTVNSGNAEVSVTILGNTQNTSGDTGKITLNIEKS